MQVVTTVIQIFCRDHGNKRFFFRQIVHCLIDRADVICKPRFVEGCQFPKNERDVMQIQLIPEIMDHFP